MTRGILDASLLVLLLLVGATLALAGCSASRVPTEPAPADGGSPRDDGGAPSTDGGAPPVCAPMQAEGEGPCLRFFGWAWIGGCVGVSGCDCHGADCGALHESLEACEAAYADCPPLATCGGFGGVPCGEGEWCDYPDGLCGGADGPGFCRLRPAACPDIYRPVCGCDGVTHPNECDANAAGVDVQSPRGPC